MNEPIYDNNYHASNSTEFFLFTDKVCSTCKIERICQILSKVYNDGDFSHWFVTKEGAVYCDTHVQKKGHKHKYKCKKTTDLFELNK